MSVKKKALIGTFLTFFIIIILGYIILSPQDTTFSIISSSVIDDNGFPSLKMDFNSNSAITVKLITPNNQVSFTENFYASQNEIIIPLSSYRENPTDGEYQVQVYDKNKNTIYTNTYNLKKPLLSIISIEGQWWKEKQQYSLIGVIINVTNNGVLPVYPESLELTIDGKSTSVQILPTAVLAGETKAVCSYLYIKSLGDGEKNCNISLYDKNGILITEATFSATPHENVLIQQFNWEYNDKNKEINIPLPQFLHDYYTELDRPDVNDYGLYVFDPYDELYLTLVKDSLLSTIGDVDDVSKINLIASFVQSLEYQVDDPEDESYEYPRYPVEMLDKSPCDCEDKAILAGNILMLMGYNVSLLDIPYHMVVGVNIKENLTEYDYYIDEYYYLETTKKGRVLGQFSGTPQEVTIYPLTPRPLLHQNWKKAEGILANGKVDFVKLELVLENLGDETANNIKIIGAFYSSEDKEFNQEKSSISSLQPNDKKQIVFQLTTPHGISTILKTQLYVNDILVEEKESETTFS